MLELTPAQRIAELRRRWDRDPKSRVFLQLAEEYRRAGRLAEAVRILETGLGHHPRYIAAQVVLGRCLVETGDLPRAITVLERAIAADPTQLVANRLLVEAYLDVEQVDKARERLDLYRLLNDRDTEIEQLEARLGALGGEARPVTSRARGAAGARSGDAIRVPAEIVAAIDGAREPDVPSAPRVEEPAVRRSHPPRGAHRLADPFGAIHPPEAVHRIVARIAESGVFPVSARRPAPIVSPVPQAIVVEPPTALPVPEPQPATRVAEMPAFEPAPEFEEAALAVPAAAPVGSAPFAVPFEAGAISEALDDFEPTAGAPIAAPAIESASFDGAPVAGARFEDSAIDSGFEFEMVDELASEPIEIVAEPTVPPPPIEPPPAVEIAPPARQPEAPSAPFASTTLGGLYLSQGHLNDAEESFEAVLASRPDDAEALAGLAEVRRRRNDAEAAFFEEAKEEESAGAVVGGLTARKVALLRQFMAHMRRGAASHVS